MDIRTRMAELRAFVRNHELTQEKLAREAGVTYSWLSKFAHGQLRNPRTETLAKLEDYYLREPIVRRRGRG
jgi:transcriptional regulator with XRE-family HTH domain